MKKLLCVFGIGIMITACNNGSNTNSQGSDSTTVDSTMPGGLSGQSMSGDSTQKQDNDSSNINRSATDTSPMSR